MTNTNAGDSIRFYFSFRSPYAWFAAERLESELGGLGVPIERIPIYPTPELFPNDPAAMPAKQAYIIQDAPRVARQYGLTIRFPKSSDTEWRLPHAAFLAAQQLGDGHRFMLELFRKRFAECLDVGGEDVVAEAASQAGLDPDAVLAGARTDELRAEASAGFRLGIERDGIFGVPSFIYAGRLYWGQDRMHFLASAVARKQGSATQ